MGEYGKAGQVDLATMLIELWARQGREGFLLSEPGVGASDLREWPDEQCGVGFRFRWLPHREIRGDVGELERRGIINADRDESGLFCDERDVKERPCFLCRRNIEVVFSKEELLALSLAGGEYFAGANFAWIAENHFTVMAAEHVDQRYDRGVLEAMLDLHRQTGGEFRVLFNGPGAGASIAWHLHFQITTESMPIESLAVGAEAAYPTVVRRYVIDGEKGVDEAHEFGQGWVADDVENHTVNLLVATVGGEVNVFVFPRDVRQATAAGKGLVGGFEVAGDFVLSSAAERVTFENSSAEMARGILGEIRPGEGVFA